MTRPALGGAAHVEERRPDDDRLRAGFEQVLGAADGSNAAADAARQLRCDLAHQRVVGPDAHRGVEVDQLNLGKLREALDPAVEIVGLDGELLALNELDDFPALEIDRRNQHTEDAVTVSELDLVIW